MICIIKWKKKFTDKVKNIKQYSCYLLIIINGNLTNFVIKQKIMIYMVNFKTDMKLDKKTLKKINKYYYDFF